MNTKSFLIERAADGIHFHAIAEQAAAGFSVVERRYSFMDSKPLRGVNHYRIKMNETTGRFQYSSIVNTVNQLNNDWSIENNPAKGSIRVNGLEKADQLYLYSAYGTKVYESIATGHYENIPCDRMATGTYFLKVVRNNSSRVVAVIVAP
jgi:hypothetical protein